ncbi:MAG: lytic transglycosylase domain-containing protein [Epsilonproteobacteria bacterium]|nr:lytic transglycosylase domain-containing protein [Campylobacterota bacterium]
MSERIAAAILSVSAQSGVDPAIYYTIIDIESGFRPFIVSTVVAAKNREKVSRLAKDLPVSVTARRYKRGFILTFEAGDKATIEEMARRLMLAGIGFDAGLMQINSRHFNQKDIRLIFDPSYNIAMGSNVLADCVARFGPVEQAIECYNKGYRLRGRSDYFRKFASSVTRNFGEKK